MADDDKRLTKRNFRQLESLMTMTKAQSEPTKDIVLRELEARGRHPDWGEYHPTQSKLSNVYRYITCGDDDDTNDEAVTFREINNNISETLVNAKGKCFTGTAIFGAIALASSHVIAYANDFDPVTNPKLVAEFPKYVFRAHKFTITCAKTSRFYVITYTNPDLDAQFKIVDHFFFYCFS